MKAPCDICKKSFTKETLDKYGGRRCKRCTNKYGLANVDDVLSLINDSKSKKKVLPKSVRMKLWKVYNDNTISERCYICNKIDKFEVDTLFQIKNVLKYRY